MNTPPLGFQAAMSRELINFGTLHSIQPGEVRKEEERTVTVGVNESATYEFGALQRSHVSYADPLTGTGSAFYPVYYLKASTAQTVQPTELEHFKESDGVNPLLLSMRSAFQLVEVRYFSVMHNKATPPLERSIEGHAFNLTEEGKLGERISDVPVTGEDIGTRSRRTPRAHLRDQRLGKLEQNYRDYDVVLRAFKAFDWRPHFLLGTSENG